jgi:hypothetical protein
MGRPRRLREGSSVVIEVVAASLQQEFVALKR